MTIQTHIDATTHLHSHISTPPHIHPTTLQSPFLTLGDSVSMRSVREDGRSEVSGGFVVEDVSVDDKMFRRLVFLAMPDNVQSQALLCKSKFFFTHPKLALISPPTQYKSISHSLLLHPYSLLYSTFILHSYHIHPSLTTLSPHTHSTFNLHSPHIHFPRRGEERREEGQQGGGGDGAGTQPPQQPLLPVHRGRLCFAVSTTQRLLL